MHIEWSETPRYYRRSTVPVPDPVPFAPLPSLPSSPTDFSWMKKDDRTVNTAIADAVIQTIDKELAYALIANFSRWGGSWWIADLECRIEEIIYTCTVRLALVSHMVSTPPPPSRNGHTSPELLVCLKAFLSPAVRDPSWILPAEDTPMVPPRLRIVYNKAVALGYIFISTARIRIYRFKPTSAQ